MKKVLKITLIAVCVLLGIIVLDILQARIFKNSPIISINKKCMKCHFLCIKGL